MNFRLSDQQLALQDAVRRYSRETLGGGLRRRVFESSDGFDAGCWNGLMKLGVGGIAVSEDYGGLGLGVVELALVAETLGEQAFPGPFLGHVLATAAIQAAGTAAQKDRWLPLLASGEALASIAFAEPGDRWSPEEWSLRVADDRISGSKVAVLHPERADILVVGTAAGGLVLVAPEPDLVHVQPVDGVDRTRRLANVIFEGAHAEPLTGTPEVAADLFALASVLLAADAFGGAMRCLDMTVEYVKTRTQFGVPIGSFQGVKHRLANAFCAVEPARGLYWYAALAQDTRQADRRRIAALAKAHLTDRFNDTARTAVELHGGIGFTWEYDLQIWVKRAMFDLAFAGTPARHRRWAMIADPEFDTAGTAHGEG